MCVCEVNWNSFLGFYPQPRGPHRERERERVRDGGFVLRTSNVPFIKVGGKSFAVAGRVLHG